MMKNLSDLTAFFREKFGFHDRKERKSRRSSGSNTMKTYTFSREDAVLFAYSSRKEEFSYPVHTFINNFAQNSIANMSSNRLVPLSESCTASLFEAEIHSDSVDLILDQNFSDSLDSLDSDSLMEFDSKVWQNIMNSLDILEQIFSNERIFQISNEVEVSEKVYVTKIPAELISSAVMNYCSRQLTQMVPSAFSELKSLTTLQLCCNSLTEVPQEICLLRRLETLSLSNNKLKSLPSTIGYLINLENLYLDRNKLSTLPRSISGLTKLRILSLAANEFTEIPRCVMLLNRLITLECDRNPNLRGVPYEITRFSQLARFHVEECPKLLKEAQYNQFAKENTRKGVPSLLECSARSLIRHRKPVLYSAPRHIKLFLSRAEECSFCSGPMIDARAINCRTIKRIDRPFPVIEQMCCAHWTTEEERHTAIFSASPKTTPPFLLSFDRRNRTGVTAPFNQFDPERSERGRRILAKFKEEELGKVLVPLSLIVDWPQYPIMS